MASHPPPEPPALIPPVLARADRVRIGLALRTRRLLKGEEQTATAGHADLGVGTLQAIETARYNVKPANIERLARYFGTSLAALLEERAGGPSLNDPGRLTREDLEVARAYHDATTAVRQAVASVLRDPDPTHLSEGQRVRAKVLAERMVRLAEPDLALLTTVLAHLAQPPPRATKRRTPAA